MASTTGTRSIVISTVVLAVAGAVVGVIFLASRPMSSTMAGMDMGSAASPKDVVEATTAPSADHGHSSGDMPGMDMPAAEMPPSASTPTPVPGDMPGMDHQHGSAPMAAADRPLAPVLGTFGGGASAVMLTAGLLRRKDRAATAAKKAARAAGRGTK